jgi:hypothetical protein
MEKKLESHKTTFHMARQYVGGAWHSGPSLIKNISVYAPKKLLNGPKMFVFHAQFFL